MDDETLVVAPLGQPVDEQSDDGTNSNGDDEQTQNDGDDAGDGDENQGSDGNGNDGDSADGGNDDGANGGDKNDDGALVDVGAKDTVLDFGEIVIVDFELNGPGLPDTHVDHRTYSVGDFDVEIDGVSFTIDETDYRIGHGTIEVEPFDVVFENVTLGSGE